MSNKKLTTKSTKKTQKSQSFENFVKKLSAFCGKKRNTMEKKKYISPRIEIIFLDNEISLALESTPPVGPSETLNSIQVPFKQESGLV